jgi:hypothetical protein
VVVVGLLGQPGVDGITIRLALAALALCIWTTALALRLRSAQGRPL